MSTTATRFKTRAQARAIEKEIVNTASRVVKLDKSISKLREQIETATQREDDPEVIAQMAQKLSRLLQAAEKVGGEYDAMIHTHKQLWNQMKNKDFLQALDKMTIKHEPANLQTPVGGHHIPTA